MLGANLDTVKEKRGDSIPLAMVRDAMVLLCLLLYISLEPGSTGS